MRVQFASSIDSNPSLAAIRVFLYLMYCHVLRMFVSQELSKETTIIYEGYWEFSRDVSAAMLVSPDNGTAAMLVSPTNPPGVELCPYANVLFWCSLVPLVKTLYITMFTP